MITNSSTLFLTWFCYCMIQLSVLHLTLLIVGTRSHSHRFSDPHNVFQSSDAFLKFLNHWEMVEKKISIHEILHLIRRLFMHCLHANHHETMNFSMVEKILNGLRNLSMVEKLLRILRNLESTYLLIFLLLRRFVFQWLPVFTVQQWMMNQMIIWHAQLHSVATTEGFHYIISFCWPSQRAFRENHLQVYTFALTSSSCYSNVTRCSPDSS